MIQQLSFRAESLSSLRDMYVALKRESIVELGPISMATPYRLTFAIPRAIALKYSSTRNGMCRSPALSRWILMKSDDEIMSFVERQIAVLSGVGLRADWERERMSEFQPPTRSIASREVTE